MPIHFSDALDDTLLFERIEQFGGGMDGFNRSTLLPPNTSQYLENLLLRDNLEMRTRPGADTLSAAPNGAYANQGLRYFDTPTYEQLIAASNQHFFKWEGAAWTAMNGANELVLSDAALIFEAAQGIDKVLFTDGTQQMQTWDGAAWSAPLGATANDPPVGATILCWHTGRMFASGKGSAADTIYVSNRLNFVGGQWNLVTRSFRVGGGEGDPIKVLASLQGYVLAVLKENSVWLVVTDPRNEPGDFSTTQTSESLSYGIGCVGRKAWCVAGNDLFFMARDGVRSLQRMQAAASQYELSAPLSEPMQPYIDRINWNYAHLIAFKKYKELVLIAVPLDTSAYNNNVLVYNTRLRCWIGIFTGWTPAAWEMTRFSGNVRLVLGENSGLVRQWKDYSDATADATYTEDGAEILSKFWTRGMLFGEPVNDKAGFHAEARFSTSNGVVNVTAVADGSDLRTWSKDLRPTTGVNLPVNLPFNLANPGTVTARLSLRDSRAFNEIYFKIESKANSAGWWALKNFTVSAFLNMLQNQ